MIRIVAFGQCYGPFLMQTIADPVAEAEQSFPCLSMFSLTKYIIGFSQYTVWQSQLNTSK